MLTTANLAASSTLRHTTVRLRYKSIFNETVKNNWYWHCTVLSNRFGFELSSVRSSRLKSAISLQRESVDPKFQVEGVAPINHSFSQKTRIYAVSHGIKIWADFSSVLSRLTDGQTEFSLLDRVCIPCSAAKSIRLSSRVWDDTVWADIIR